MGGDYGFTTSYLVTQIFFLRATTSGELSVIITRHAGIRTNHILMYQEPMTILHLVWRRISAHLWHVIYHLVSSPEVDRRSSKIIQSDNTWKTHVGTPFVGIKVINEQFILYVANPVQTACHHLRYLNSRPRKWIFDILSNYQNNY